ncbi:hypothetical protein JKP88DRAFT_339699 [Tribonema minus]|uniref:Rubisco LSMT substrate-binding domain-containing protein n=1 Tax=Tribonema minus TaxID=303371 RepID=A0A835YG90_9STRA|nr:hypothetical protein JKP88DRAFT_339699 [Tribonema minus]
MGKTETDTGRAMSAALQSGESAEFAQGIVYTAIYILTDRADPDSRFSPYYATLPADQANMPSTWGPDKLAWLAGSYAQVDTLHQQSRLRRTYDWVLRVHPPFARLATFEEFTWAYATVRSRAYSVAVKGAQGGAQEAMVPFADMFNHRLPCSVATGWSREGGVFSLRARARIAAGEELCVSYGQRQKRDFLLSFGFTMEDNFQKGRCIELVGLTPGVSAQPGDCEDDTELEFTVDAADVEVERKLRLLRAMPTTWHPSGPFWSIEPGACGAADSEAASFNLKGQQCSALPPQAHGSVRVAMNGRRERALGDALTLLRAACASAAELSQLESAGWGALRGRLSAALNSRNEACALRRLARLAEAYLGAFPTTLAEDLELLGSGTLAPYSDRRNALVVVMTDKRVLHDVRDLVRGALLCLPDSAADRRDSEQCYSIESEAQRRWDVVAAARPEVRELLQSYCAGVAAAVAYREECRQLLQSYCTGLAAAVAYREECRQSHGGALTVGSGAAAEEASFECNP